jgi:flagellar basal-body rod protein FlgB
MLDKLTSALDFQGKALVLRAERQRTIASNIANADTPGYAARDFDFSRALEDATGSDLGSGALRPTAAESGYSVGTTNARHIPIAGLHGSGTGSLQGYTVQTSPSMDNNSVDMDRERANFTDNSVRYEATLRFINGQSKTILSAIQGQ